jgi:hypothetical protein
MTFRPSGTRFAPQPRLALILLSLAAIAGLSMSHAQTAAPESAEGVNGNQGSENSNLPKLARDRFDPVRFMNAFASHYYLHPENPSVPQFVFFPPVPPPLESEIPVLAPYDTGPPAPPELEAFVGETFYPLFGARLALEDLPRPLRERIVAYRLAKIGLQEALRAQILGLMDVDPNVRGKQLVAFANQQAPKILELEATAEQLRADLRPVHVLGLQVEGIEPGGHLSRKVHPVRETPADAAGLARESEAITGAAFFQEGLPLPQRRLLLEAAAELQAKINPGFGTTGIAPGMRIIFFSPEASRIPIPGDLQEPLKGTVSEYLASKDALKAELRDALAATDSAPADARKETLAQLSSAQESRIARVEALAEEIRLGLAAVPNPQGPPALAPIPPELASRISDYRRHKVELLRTLRALLVAPSPRGEAAHNPKTEQADAGAGTLAWMHDGSTRTEIETNELRVSVAEFDHRQNELIAALNTEEAGIRTSLAEYVRSAGGLLDSKSVNDLLRDFEAARQRQELLDRYRDYQAAVLLPGLSPAQRRILFDAAIEQLALPLPAGERTN